MALQEYKYLSVGDLQGLRSYSLTSRRPVHGRYAGRHASPQRGQSVEFTDYRPYSPGDEVADIDWKAYARSDKLFLKLFEHQTDMTVSLLIDGSASMGFRGIDPGASAGSGRAGHASKFDYACRVAAGLAYLMTRQRDRVSLAIAQDGLARYVEPGATFPHLLSMLEVMERIHPAGQAMLTDALGAMSPRLSRQTLVVVLSDLHVEPEPLLQELGRLTSRGSRVVVFHLLHPDELSLPPVGEVLFEESESGERLTLDTAAAGGRYNELVTRFVAEWSARLKGRGAENYLTPTSTPYVGTIRGFLRERAGYAG